MEEMRWSEAMSVGVPELDGDHKGLIALINRLAAPTGERPRRTTITQTLQALKRYAEFHFGREQDVMKACGFTGIDFHIGEHDDFVRRIDAISQSFDAESDDFVAGAVYQDLHGFLVDWLNHHILIQDMAYRPFTEAKTAEARSAAQAFRLPRAG